MPTNLGVHSEIRLLLRLARPKIRDHRAPGRCKEPRRVAAPHSAHVALLDQAHFDQHRHVARVRLAPEPWRLSGAGPERQERAAADWGAWFGRQGLAPLDPHEQGRRGYQPNTEDRGCHNIPAVNLPPISGRRKHPRGHETAARARQQDGGDQDPAGESLRHRATAGGRRHRSGRAR